MADFPIPVIPVSRPSLDRAFGSPKPEVRPAAVKPVAKSDSEPEDPEEYDEPEPDQPRHELDLDA